MSQISCDNAQKTGIKVLRTDLVRFATLYNPILQNINILIIKYLHILDADLDLT